MFWFKLYCNSPIYKSEIGDVLNNKYKNLCDFVVIYHYDEVSQQTYCSLRSQEPFNVSEIAKLFGGGGHKQAAGLILKGFKNRL